jgi:glycosyltransferase involved in cell wall biosynthesis
MLFRVRLPPFIISGLSPEKHSELGDVIDMKVLHLWASDSGAGGGGGAVSMYRLHCGLREKGIESRILTRRKSTGDPDVSVLPDNSILDRLIGAVTSRVGLNDIHKVSSFGLRKHPLFRWADVVTIHGTHSGFLNYLALPSLTREKPTVFVMCDMWLLTGHCVQSYDCDRWKTGCGSCPYLDSYPAVPRDATRLEWKLKKRTYARSRLSLVSPGSWLPKLVPESIAAHFPIQVIHNGIDTQIFAPRDRVACREALGIPQDRKILMFSSLNLKDRGKGGDLLAGALEGLPASLKSKLFLLLMGNRSEGLSGNGIPKASLGYVQSDRLQAMAYSAADLFVLPTRAETLGNVLVESIACGTPCVSFRVGGVPDVVRPGVTGYLAEPESVEGLRKGIVELLENDDLRASMSPKCRDIAVQEFRLELQVERYLRLYEQLLSEAYEQKTKKAVIPAGTATG